MGIRSKSESGAGEKKLRKNTTATQTRKRLEDESAKKRADKANVASNENAKKEESDRVIEGDEHRVNEPHEELKSRKSKHIHPCICDLSDLALQRVVEYQIARKAFHNKYTLRRTVIEEQIRQKEAEAEERRRLQEEEQELYGDEYTLQGGQMKRKKRSARRASMVSLGVRQIIHWKKEPKIKVVFTKTWRLRYENTRYCGKKKYYLPPIEHIDFKKPPLVPVQLTRAFELRHNFNVIIKNKLIAEEDRRPPFVLAYYTSIV